MLRLFVTGTDTGVGKTRVATALCGVFAAAGARVAAMKPVASGCAPTREGLRNDDALALLAAMTVPAHYDQVNPYAFEPPIAPHIAAREACRSIDFKLLDRCFEDFVARSDVTVVEGAGGWLAPLDETHTFADLAQRWRLDVVLVVGLRLGCLNHAQLTAESIAGRGLHLAGWVGNCVDLGFERCGANLDFLQARIAAPFLGTLPYAPRGSATEAARILGPAVRELAPLALP